MGRGWRERERRERMEREEGERGGREGGEREGGERGGRERMERERMEREDGEREDGEREDGTSSSEAKHTFAPLGIRASLIIVMELPSRSPNLSNKLLLAIMLLMCYCKTITRREREDRNGKGDVW